MDQNRISNDSNNQNETIFSTDILHLIEDMHSADLDRIDLAIERLRVMDHAKTIEQLTKALHHPDPEYRCQAIELLLLLDASETLELVLPLLNDPIDFVRYNLLLSLSDTPTRDHRLVDPLIGTLIQDNDADNRSMAAWLLGVIGDEKAAPALQLAVLQDFSTDYEDVTVSSIAEKSLASMELHRTNDLPPIP